MERIYKEIEYNKVIYDFTLINEFINTRNGFNHKSYLIYEGHEISEYTAHYINRTWEPYTYYSSMYNAIYVLLEQKKENYTINFKNEKGYKKLTKSRKIELEKYLEQFDKIKILEKLLKSL